MLDNEPDTNESPVGTPTSGGQPTAVPETAASAPPRRRRAASRPAGPPTTAVAAPPIEISAPEQAPQNAAAKKAAAKRPARKTVAKKAADDQPALEMSSEPSDQAASTEQAGPSEQAAPPVRTPRKRAARKVATAPVEAPAAEELVPDAVGTATDVAPVNPEVPAADETTAEQKRTPRSRVRKALADPFEVPEIKVAPTRDERSPAVASEVDPVTAAVDALAESDTTSSTVTTRRRDSNSDDSNSDDSNSDDSNSDDSTDDSDGDDSDDDSQDSGDGSPRRRRRRRGGRRRRRGGADDDSSDGDEEPDSATDTSESEKSDSGNSDAEAGSVRPQESETSASEDSNDSDSDDDEGDGRRRRRRRRSRRGEESAGAADDPTDVVVRVREPRNKRKPNTEVTGIDGSTRMEAKRQRRKEGREAGRRRPPILSEAEFLARRESVSRKMIIRQRDDLSQIAVLEDDILVEHYVDRDSATSLIGNVYLGRVQNVLPSMEAAFIDIGRGRNAVLYAGELDWDSLGAEGHNRKVEKVLKSGQTILVQVSKDPVGAKGARLTNHVSIPGRYIVYAPGGHLSGISRKLPDTERKRLKDILADLVGDSASVIVRTAAEGASEEELVRDVNRLKAQWEDIERKVKAGNAPQQLYGEPDLTVRIVRDLFTEDFSELIIQGNGAMNDAYDAVEGYVTHVAPHLKERLTRWEPTEDQDLFTAHRLDEQIAKALERKVFLPSGGSLVIDRTEAMTVIDVNTGKFTGAGGNLEATVTSNNLEAAEEIVRQLRLRDIGGIIVIDFIDMVLPNNRELLLRRLVECLGRDRTRHQVAEVTSLGLVQMTRKKIGTGLLEAFTVECPHCHGRGVELHDVPVESQQQADGGARDQRGDHRQRRNQSSANQSSANQSSANQSSANQSSANQSSANQGAAQQGDDASNGHSSAGSDNSDRHSRNRRGRRGRGSSGNRDHNESGSHDSGNEDSGNQDSGNQDSSNAGNASGSGLDQVAAPAIS